MKTRNSIICLLCAAALLLSLCGCSALSGFFAETKEDVLLRLTEYVDGRNPTAATVTIDFAMTSELGDVPTDITISLENRTLIASETESYSEGEFSYTINDQEVSHSTQVYNFAENGSLLTFTHVDSTDRWFRSETPLPDLQTEVTPTPAPTNSEGTDSAAAEVSIPEEYTSLLLEEGTQTLGDQEVYVLTGSVDGEVCKAFLLDSLNLDALTARLQSAASKGIDPNTINLKNLDFSTLTADIIVYLNKESCAPVQIELTLNGMNLLITDFMAMLPEQTAALLGSSVTIKPVRAVFTDISFDPVTIPQVTEESRIQAMQESFDPDQGDGSFVLQQYGDAVKITAQNKWSPTELGYCFAAFRNGDNTRSAHYELYQNMTGEDFIALVESGMIPAMEAQELTVTTAAGEAIGAYQTHSISGNGLNVYLAYRTVGNSLLGIYAEDSSGADLTAVLTPILEAVEDYQLEY